MDIYLFPFPGEYEDGNIRGSQKGLVGCMFFFSLCLFFTLSISLASHYFLLMNIFPARYKNDGEKQRVYFIIVVVRCYSFLFPLHNFIRVPTSFFKNRQQVMYLCLNTVADYCLLIRNGKSELNNALMYLLKQLFSKKLGSAFSV